MYMFFQASEDPLNYTHPKPSIVRKHVPTKDYTMNAVDFLFALTTQDRKEMMV